MTYYRHIIEGIDVSPWNWQWIVSGFFKTCFRGAQPRKEVYYWILNYFTALLSVAEEHTVVRNRLPAITSTTGTRISTTCWPRSTAPSSATSAPAPPSSPTGKPQTARKTTDVLTLSPPSTTNMQYANSLDPDETPNNSASHPDPSCLILR